MPEPNVIRLPPGFFDPGVKERVFQHEFSRIAGRIATEGKDPLVEILQRLRLLTAEPVGELGKFIVEKKGGLWVAEEP